MIPLFMKFLLTYIIAPSGFNSTMLDSMLAFDSPTPGLVSFKRIILYLAILTFTEFQMEEQYISSPPLNPSMLSAYDDPKLMPIYARSLSSSPPRASLTPEQRELKRQRDHARRDSKTRARRERSVSNPYVVSNRTSPDLMPRTLPEYSSSLTPSPLLTAGPLPSNHSLPSQQAQPSPALSSSSYLTPYSPAIPDTSNQDMYGPVFTMSPADFSASPTFTPMPYSQSGPEGSIHNYV